MPSSSSLGVTSTIGRFFNRFFISNSFPELLLAINSFCINHLFLEGLPQPGLEESVDV
jgi:hypothetical protein